MNIKNDVKINLTLTSRVLGLGLGIQVLGLGLEPQVLINITDCSTQLLYFTADESRAEWCRRLLFIVMSQAQTAPLHLPDTGSTFAIITKPFITVYTFIKKQTSIYTRISVEM